MCGFISGSLFCSTDLCICFCASTMLFDYCSFAVYSEVWGVITPTLFFFSRWLQQFGVFCSYIWIFTYSGSVKNVMGVLIDVISHVWLIATLWTVAHQAPLSMGFSRQEYWSGLSCPSPGNLPNPGIDPGSPALQADSLPLNLQIALGSMAILKIFILLIQGNRVSFHFFKLSSIPLISVFSGFRL